MLSGKKILLGVCGSIAAYKAAHLIRLLIKEGAEVQVVASSSAFSFITPLTLSTLSKRPVYSEFVKDETGLWNNHVDLALWADLIVIAPATANTMAKFANGLCDSLLSAVYLSARSPVLIAPAMDLDMYLHPATIANIKKLKSYGNQLMDAEYGELASGLTGAGRMPEPEIIVETIKSQFSENSSLKGKKAVVTAGPTYEPIDPVRFIGNRSSGKMGYAIAEDLRNKGAEVTLISGPTSLPDPSGIRVIRVEKAEEMYNNALELFPQMDIAVLAAAVADYKPSDVKTEKIKKSGDTLDIHLFKTQDIAGEIGKIKKANQFVVGFALETENELEHAKGKLERKNFDFIVLNTLKDKGAGFAVDTNKITILHKNNNLLHFELKNKKEVAADIVAAIIDSIR